MNMILCTSKKWGNGYEWYCKEAEPCVKAIWSPGFDMSEIDFLRVAFEEWGVM